MRKQFETSYTSADGQTNRCTITSLPRSVYINVLREAVGNKPGTSAWMYLDPVEALRLSEKLKEFAQEVLTQ
jgi:hypothetical protein